MAGDAPARLVARREHISCGPFDRWPVGNRIQGSTAPQREVTYARDVSHPAGMLVVTVSTIEDH